MSDPDESVWVDAAPILGAVADARMLMINDSRLAIEVPSITTGHRALDDAIGRVAELFRDLPGHYIYELIDGYQALARVVTETHLADGDELDA